VSLVVPCGQTDRRTDGRTNRHDADNSCCANAPKCLTLCSVNRDEHQIFAGVTAFLSTGSRMTLHAYKYAVLSGPVRQAEVGLALPPAVFRQITAPSTHRYTALFCAADKVFPQISNLESNTVPVTDPNAFTLLRHYNSFPFYRKINQMHGISNLFYFGATLYMFRTVSPSIIRSVRLYIQHHTIHLLWLLAGKQPQNLYDIHLILYEQS
jgi:hypothetical protein